MVSQQVSKKIMKYHERRKAKFCLRSTVFENHRKSPIKEKVSYVYKKFVQHDQNGSILENFGKHEALQGSHFNWTKLVGTLYM